ncbi:MAG: 50S ribosomal protein L9 [Bacteroidia bacterium]
MQVILKQDVSKLGFKNDVVKVRHGYARNFLIPRGVATLATEGNLKSLTEVKKQQVFKEEKFRKEATANAEKLTGLVLKVGSKAGESGKIFGSVTNIQVAEALKKAGFDIERKNIEIIGEAIKQVGAYTAKVRLFKEITSTLNFEVVAE